MTLIECFDRELVENMTACLRMSPDRVIFLGDSAVMEQPLKRCRKFLTDRNMDVRMVRCHVDLQNVRDIVVAGVSGSHGRIKNRCCPRAAPEVFIRRFLLFCLSDTTASMPRRTKP